MGLRKEYANLRERADNAEVAQVALASQKKELERALIEMTRKRDEARSHRDRADVHRDQTRLDRNKRTCGAVCTRHERCKTI